MSHDKDNAACPCNQTSIGYVFMTANKCTCPPAANEVEQIRKRHDRVARLAQKAVVILDQMDLDRATLLRNVAALVRACEDKTGGMNRQLNRIEETLAKLQEGEK